MALARASRATRVTSSPALARCAPNNDPNAPAPRMTIFMALSYLDFLAHAKFLCHGAEAVHGAFDGTILDAIGDAEVAGGPKAAPRHGEDMFRLECLDEGHIVVTRRLRKDVEGPLRLHELIAHRREVVAQQVAFALVLAHLHRHPL